MIIERNGKQVEVGYCCFMGCDKPAEFEITKEVGGPEDYTHACEAHVGALLMEGANPEQLVLDCATKWAMQKMQVSLNKEILKAVAEQKVREGKPN